MLIQCPACQFQTNISDSKEGAKLRCPDCERVFVARPRAAGGARVGSASSRAAARGSSSGDATRYVLIGGGVLVAGALALMYSRGGDEIAAAPEVREHAPAEPAAAKQVEGSDWNSAPVVFVRELHDLAFAQDETKLLLALDGERAFESAGEGGTWSELSRTEQTDFLAGLVQQLAHGDAHEMVAAWAPFDGWVEERDGDTRLVRVRVAHRDEDAQANRHVAWRIVKQGERWKAYAWERWISPEEQEALEREARAAEVAARPQIVRKTLSDGSKVVEGEVRPIPYDEDTPDELRARIDALVLLLTDMEAPGRQRIDAKDELVEIGKPAIPPLLTVIADTPHVDLEAGMKLMQVNLTLMDITGYITSFKPHETLGASEERQESGLKQWFGWYDRKYKRFTEAPEVLDPLADEEED